MRVFVPQENRGRWSVGHTDDQKYDAGRLMERSGHAAVGAGVGVHGAGLVGGWADRCLYLPQRPAVCFVPKLGEPGHGQNERTCTREPPPNTTRQRGRKEGKMGKRRAVMFRMYLLSPSAHGTAISKASKPALQKQTVGPVARTAQVVEIEELVS